jgi:glycosyltransferase involved in cell wall biosynthesis/GT2 family glycosyltransferase
MDLKTLSRVGHFLGRRLRGEGQLITALTNVLTTVDAPRKRRSTQHIWQEGPMPLVGVVTPVRNRLTWTLSFVQQMLEQTYPFLRIYIVDADSTDGTPISIRSLGHSSLEVISVASSNFWTGSTNEGVRRALADGCDYILTLNDDAVVPAQFVEHLVTAAEDNNLKIVGSMISYSSEPGRIWAAGVYNDWEAGNFLQTKHANVWADTIDNVKQEIMEVEGLCGNGTLIRRSVFNQIGLYNAKFTPHYHADTEFTLRAGRQGISSYVATNAWIYNRFYEATDGAMTARNRRHFSLRSANYLRPLVFILFNYCPENLRVTAFCRYIQRYLYGSNERSVSRFARTAFFLSNLREKGDFCSRNFYTTGYRELDFCNDLNITLKLSGKEFLQVSSILILRRLLDDVEESHYLRFVETEASRRIVLLDLMKRPEFTSLRDKSPELSILLGEWSGIPDHNLLRKCSVPSFVICVFLLKENRLPTSTELQGSTLSLVKCSREEMYSELVKTDIDKDHLGKSIIRPMHIPRTSLKLGPIVYINADVLCMAQLDNRAKTGVFRYAKSLIDYILQDDSLTVKLFHSPALDHGWEGVAQTSPYLVESHVDMPMADSSDRMADIAFYPYFPFHASDNRFLTQRRVFTLCDLFPVTNPDWFTKEATSNFLRQLRHLPSADHIFCISAETERNLKAYAPSLRGTTSVAHLGVKAPVSEANTSAAQITKLLPTQRYMLCIGTLEPRKNLGTVIRAMAHLRTSEFDDVHLVVVGASGWNVDVAEEASALGNHVRFLGHVKDSELWTLYRSAVCTVFPSLAEGFGFPIVESFASGTPVITSNRSSMLEIAEDYALLVNPLDEGAISAAMITMLRNPDIREKLAKRGLERAREYTWEKCASLHVQEFLRIHSCAYSRDSGETKPRAIRT